MTEITLAEKVQNFGLEPEQSKPLLDNFGYYFVQAHKLVTQAGGIKVTDESQVAEMKQAKELRKQLKDLRVAADKTRFALKEGYLRGGNAVQSIYNDIEKIIKPVEAELEQKEKFAEIKQMERMAAKYEERIGKLSKYVPDVSIYSLREMSDQGFETLLADAMANFKAKQEALDKAAAEKFEQEKKEKLYYSRKEQLIPYWSFLKGDQPSIDFGEIPQEQFDIILREVKKAQADFTAELEKNRAENERLRKEAIEKERLADIEKKKQDEIIAKERKAQQDKIAAANKIAADAEKKLREQKEAQLEKERKEREAAEAQKRADEEVRRKALLAPDKEKLVMLAGDLSLFRLPVVQSREAGAIMADVSKRIDDIVLILQEGARKL